MQPADRGGNLSTLPVSVLIREAAMAKVAKVPVIMQMETVECGAACLAMVLAYHGKLAAPGTGAGRMRRFPGWQQGQELGVGGQIPRAQGQWLPERARRPAGGTAARHHSLELQPL